MKTVFLSIPALAAAANQEPLRSEDNAGAVGQQFNELATATRNNICKNYNSYNSQAGSCYNKLTGLDTDMKDLKIFIQTEEGKLSAAASARDAAMVAQEAAFTKLEGLKADRTAAQKAYDIEKAKLDAQINHQQELKQRLAGAKIAVNNAMGGSTTTLLQTSKIDSTLSFVQTVAQSMGRTVSKAQMGSNAVVELITQLEADVQDELTKTINLEKATTNAHNTERTSNVVKQVITTTAMFSQGNLTVTETNKANNAKSALQDDRDALEGKLHTYRSANKHCKDVSTNYDYDQAADIQKLQALELVAKIMHPDNMGKDEMPAVQVFTPDEMSCRRQTAGTGSSDADSAGTTLLQTGSYTDALKSLADRNPEYVSLLSLAQSTNGPQSTAAMKTLADSMVDMLKNLREQATQLAEKGGTCDTDMMKVTKERDEALRRAQEARTVAMDKFEKEKSLEISIEKKKLGIARTQADINELKAQKNTYVTNHNNDQKTNNNVLKASKKATKHILQHVADSDNAAEARNRANTNAANTAAGTGSSDADSAGTTSGLNVAIQLLKKTVSETTETIEKKEKEMREYLEDFNEELTDMESENSAGDTQNAMLTTQMANAAKSRKIAVNEMKSNWKKLYKALESYTAVAASCLNNQMTWEEALAARRQEIATLKTAKQSLCDHIGGDSANLGAKPSVCDEVQ